MHPSETPHEYAIRAARRLHLDRPALDRLAEEVTVAAYSGGDVPDAVVTDTDEIRHRVSRTLRERRGRWQQITWRADPRPLVETIPPLRLEERVPEPVG
jgi:hypothetical protein